MEKKKMILLAGGASVVCTVVICVILLVVWLFNQDDETTEDDDSTSTSTGASSGGNIQFNNTLDNFAKLSDSLSRVGNVSPRCIGYWTPCSPECGGSGKRTFMVQYSTSCRDPDSTSTSVISAGTQKDCVTRACGQDCVGSWSGFGACSVTCGIGSRSNVFTVSTSAGIGGRTCAEKYGAQANINVGSTAIYESCNTNIPCATPRDCVGEIVPGQCSTPCGPGTITDEYVITQNAENGGTACPHLAGPMPPRVCNLGSCCDPQFLTPWNKSGFVCDPQGTGTSIPQVYWTRRLDTGVTRSPGCTLTLAATKNTTASCPPRMPSNGTCVNGYSWDNTTKQCTPNNTYSGTNPRCRPRNAVEQDAFNRATNNGIDYATYVSYVNSGGTTGDGNPLLPYGPRWLVGETGETTSAANGCGFSARYGPNIYNINEPNRMGVDCLPGTSQVPGTFNCATVLRQSNIVSLTCQTGFNDADLISVACRPDLPDLPPEPYE